MLQIYAPYVEHTTVSAEIRALARNVRGAHGGAQQ